MTLYLKDCSNMTFNPEKRYETNPFVDVNAITTSKKKVVIGQGNDILLNQETGEVSTTNVITYREVDDEQFVKLFTQNIGLTFNLSANGIKALTVLMWVVQTKISKDEVVLDKYTHEQFSKANPKLNMAYVTFRKGLNELVKSQILAKSKRMGDYFINPHFLFNGDRMRFITEIKRKKEII